MVILLWTLLKYKIWSTIVEEYFTAFLESALTRSDEKSPFKINISDTQWEMFFQIVTVRNPIQNSPVKTLLYNWV